MIDRSRDIVELLAVHLAEADLGRGTAVIDAEALTVVRSDAEDRALRVPFSTIDHVGVHDDELGLVLRDGTRMRLATVNATRLADHLFAHCCTVPELTRTLRAFGSRRGQRTSRLAGAAEQQRFFAPLVDARRQAVRAGSPFDAVELFDARAIRSAIDATLRRFAVERYGENGPARRALEAELTDLTEPLHRALETLGETAANARTVPGDLRVWREWCASLKTTFEAADRVWLALDAALDAAMFGTP